MSSHIRFNTKTDETFENFQGHSELVNKRNATRSTQKAVLYISHFSSIADLQLMQFCLLMNIPEMSES